MERDGTGIAMVSGAGSDSGPEAVAIMWCNGRPMMDMMMGRSRTWEAPVERDGTGIAMVSGAGSDSGPEAEGRENRRVVEEREGCVIGWWHCLL